MNKEVDKTKLKPSQVSQSMSVNKKNRAQILSNVDLNVEAYLGGTSLTIGELTNLNLDDVISLDAPLNTAIQLRLNGVAIATGELVAVGDKFGVRVTAIAE